MGYEPTLSLRGPYRILNNNLNKTPEQKNKKKFPVWSGLWEDHGGGGGFQSITRRQATSPRQWEFLTNEEAKDS